MNSSMQIFQCKIRTTVLQDKPIFTRIPLEIFNISYVLVTINYLMAVRCNKPYDTSINIDCNNSTIPCSHNYPQPYHAPHFLDATRILPLLSNYTVSQYNKRCKYSITLNLSLIHIQMCIRDRYQVYYSLRKFTFQRFFIILIFCPKLKITQPIVLCA